MASVAIMVGAAIVNAVAFTAGNALYDKFGRGDGGAEERIRHDKVIEDQQKAANEWNQKRLETLDWINNKLREQNDARLVFSDVDKALEFYNQTHPREKIFLPPKPEIQIESSYYDVTFSSICGILIGYIVHKVYN